MEIERTTPGMINLILASYIGLFMANKGVCHARTHAICMKLLALQNG